MFEPRVYRAAFVPALLAVVLTMFSLQSRPRPLPQGLAADVLFDGRVAAAEASRIAAAAPDRRPGGAGDAQIAERVARALRRQRLSGRAAALQPRRRPARQRDRPPRRALAAPDRGGRRSRRLGRPGRHRQRRRHRRADRAGARARGPPDAQDARARLARRRDARGGGGDASCCRSCPTRTWSTACWRSPTWPRRSGAGRSCRRGRPATSRAGIGLQRTVADSIRRGARRRARLGRARWARSPGSRSRSGSAPRGC